MRCARIKAEGTGYYHIMSRAIEGRFIFGNSEKEKFRKNMRNLASFCGLNILTYSIMSSHWHILLEVPERREISDAELIRRLGFIYDDTHVEMIRSELSRTRQSGDHDGAEQLKARYTYRMYDLSLFCKSLKQNFSQYYNKQNNRSGPLWNQRFKSILVENSDNALLTMAAYIELNAVRAGIVRDPKDYRWCGYGEAIMGSKQARKGIAALMKPLGIETSWKEQGREYRKHLYMQGRQKGAAPKGEQLRPGFSAEEVEQILLEGGKLPRHTILRCRVRYFSDGLVLGSQAFVESAYNRYRSQFGLKRKTGARAMKYGQWDGLTTMRDLRKAVILVPVTV